MRYSLILLMGAMLTCLGVVASSAAPPNASQAIAKALPPFPEIQQAVLRYFDAQPDFEINDLITRDVVEPLLTRLQRMGLPLTDKEQILDKVPEKGEFLVDQMSTPNGRKFMRSISGYKDGYDRVDRLSRMPYGQQTIRDLIRGPGGERLIEYMTTAPGGKELGKQLENTPTGKQFNTPTGRIYTVTMLLARLKQSYLATQKATAAKNKSP